MPIRTIYKLRAQRPTNILTLAGKHAMVGNIYVSGDNNAVSGVTLYPGERVGYFLPSAKVKPNFSAMKPLTLHKVNGYKRPDTGEILLIFKNVNYHFSGFMKMTRNHKRSNCTLRWDSSISINKVIKKGEYLVCYWNQWEEIDITKLPQYKRHVTYNQKYSFNRRKKIRTVKRRTSPPPPPPAPTPTQLDISLLQPPLIIPKSTIVIPEENEEASLPKFLEDIFTHSPDDKILKDTDSIQLEHLASDLMDCYEDG